MKALSSQSSFKCVFAGLEPVSRLFARIIPIITTAPLTGQGGLEPPFCLSAMFCRLNYQTF